MTGFFLSYLTVTFYRLLTVYLLQQAKAILHVVAGKLGESLLCPFPFLRGRLGWGLLCPFPFLRGRLGWGLLSLA